MWENKFGGYRIVALDSEGNMARETKRCVSEVKRKEVGNRLITGK